MTPDYTPHAWHWLVVETGGYWSSATAAYVDTHPEHYTRIATEAELSDVLRQYGLRGPHVSADDVRAEAQRRIVALVGAVSMEACMVKQLNALMRATELNDKVVNGSPLTESEAAEAESLRGMASVIKAIRSASNAMEANPPADYRGDENWP